MNKKDMAKELEKIAKRVREDKIGKEVTTLVIFYNKNTFQTEVNFDHPPSQTETLE